MQIFNNLDRVNKKLSALHIYETRVRRVFIFRTLRNRILERIVRRSRELSGIRSRLLDAIAMDPALQKEYRLRRERQLASTLQPQTDLSAAADKLLQLRFREREAKTAYQMAIWYYKSGDWKGDSIAVENVTAMMDHLKAIYADAESVRTEHQAAFEQSVAHSRHGDPTHIVAREELITAARFRFKEPADKGINGFEQWHHAQTGRKASLPEPEPRTLDHKKRRELDI